MKPSYQCIYFVCVGGTFPQHNNALLVVKILQHYCKIQYSFLRYVFTNSVVTCILKPISVECCSNKKLLSILFCDFSELCGLRVFFNYYCNIYDMYTINQILQLIIVFGKTYYAEDYHGDCIRNGLFLQFSCFALLALARSQILTCRQFLYTKRHTSRQALSLQFFK